MTRLRFNQAIVSAIHDEMAADSSVILLGEDVGEAGGVFKTSEGLLERFGPERIRDTPISEMGFIGAAVGAAATGLRPVAEIMFVEFLGVALDQLVTEAAKFRYLSRGQVTVPLVVRASCGAGLGFGAQHSQVLDSWFRGTPGLKVCIPSNPQAAYGLLRSAIRDDDPVVFLETRSLYGDRAEVALGDEGLVHLGAARLEREGPDVTIVSAGQLVKVALAAADEEPGWSADVIDLQTLTPWDRRTVMESVGRTRRLVLLEEGSFSSGWGQEIAYEVAAEMFGELHAPVLRITCPDTPVPFAAGMERRFLPSVEYVSNQVTELIDTGRRPLPWWQGAGIHV
jgi:pyruvate dehydrogenase E1 component beta subunit